jgi:hypothetical protein
VTSQPVPPLAEREKPPLSVTLTGRIHPHVCQSCGKGHLQVETLTRWKEADEWDRTSAKSPIVVLCEKCSKKLIDPHPRLYVALWPQEPWPGAIDICIACKHRDGTRCANPNAKINGGSGIAMKGGRHSYCHLNFGGGKGWSGQMWTSQPTECTGREECKD